MWTQTDCLRSLFQTLGCEVVDDMIIEESLFHLFSFFIHRSMNACTIYFYLTESRKSFSFNHPFIKIKIVYPSLSSTFQELQNFLKVFFSQMRVLIESSCKQSLQEFLFVSLLSSVPVCYSLLLMRSDRKLGKEA